MSLPGWRRLRLSLEALEPRLLLSATSATQELADVDALAAQTAAPPEGPVGAIAYPTAYDQYMLELTNRARSDPDAEATRLGLDALGGLNEGVEPEDTISSDPKQPLAFNLNIIDASQKHSQWMLDNDTFSHNEPVPNFDAGDRMANAGYSFPNTPGSSWGWGENIGMVMSWPDPYDMTTGTRMNYENLFVDEDYEPLPPGTPRGHRVNICNGDFREIGVGVLPGIYSGAYEWEAVAATQDFAYSSYVGTSRFLTGVAYDDDAVLDDDFYTPGEGLGGVLIRATRQPDCVVFSATTWDSGGYSLLLEPGTYDVVATSNDLGRVEYVGVVIGDDNVKRDYTPDMSTLDETGPVVNVVSPAVTSPFVQVSGTGFVADGGPFYVAGTNSYYLMEYAANPATRSQVDEALQDAADMGLNVVRTWAFADGYTAYDEDLLVDDPYLQPQPGVYNEAFFQGLDYTIYRAGQLGLRLTLPLVNHWEPYGGMDQYVAWDSTYGTAPFATERNDFYTDDDTVVWYKDHVSAVLNRVNTFTGTAYKDDPTIFSWELANEPRAEWDWSGDLLQDWIDDMADHVKSIDSTHLLTTGLEGFYDGSGDGDWMRNGFSGTDFVRNHTGDTIDYAVLHNWPEHWALDEAGSVAWYQEHIDDAHGVLGKPVVMEEFGLSRDDDGTSATERDSLFQALLDTGEAADAAGWNFWVLYDDAYTDYDGFGVYSPADRSTAAILSGAADALAAKTVPALPLFAGVTTIEVHFNEAMDPATIVAANIELLGSGGDGVFGNGNDIVYAPASVVLDPDGCTSHINLASALPADKYRFTLDGTSSITDAAGNRLDGEYLGSLPSGDGTPGGDFVGAFVVAETPESLGVDMAARVGGEPNPTGPAPRTLGLTGIVSRVNPSSTLYAVQVSGGDWLRFDSAAGRTDVYADGSAPEWRTAQEWARNRLRGLDAGATYEFLAMAGDGAGSQTPLVAVGAYATNASGDVNATGGLRPVRGSDFALVRYAAGASGRLGIELLWAGDNNDDGVIDQTDVYDVLDLLKHPSGAATGAVGQGAVAASTFTDSSEPTPLTSMEALLVMEYLEQREDDRTEASGIVTPGERLDAAAAWDEETNG